MIRGTAKCLNMYTPHPIKRKKYQEVKISLAGSGAREREQYLVSLLQ